MVSPRAGVRFAAIVLLASSAAVVRADGDAPSSEDRVEPATTESAPRQGPRFGEEVVVVGRRNRPADATAASTVVDARQFAGEAKSVAELVTTAPGVAVNGYGGLGQLSTISIRGSGSEEVQVLLDGLPLQTAGGGGVDLSRIPRAWIDRIEVVRGAAGASYGPGAMAGAVDILTRREAAGSWSANASGGSFGTFSGGVDGAVGGDGWGLLLAGAADHTQGDFTYVLDRTPSRPGSDLETRTREHNRVTSGGGLAKLWAQLGASRLDVALQLSGGARDLPGIAYFPTPDDRQDDLRGGLIGRLTSPLASDLDLELGLTAREDRLNVLIAPDEFRQADHAGEVSGRLVWRTGAHALSWRVAAGAERLTVAGSGAHAWGTFAATLGDEVTLASGRLVLAPGLRYDRQGPFDGLSARLGATWRFDPVLSVRASAGRAFRVPSFAELYLQQGLAIPSPGLTPESSLSADAALVAEGPFGLASAGVFAQLYQDLVVYEAMWDRRMKPYNEGKAQARGVEVELASAPLGPARVSASLSYTLLLTETLRGDALRLGKELPHRAPHRLFARIAAEPGPFDVHGEAHYVARQFGDPENSDAQQIPAALTFNAGAAVRVARAPDTHLGLEVRNLLDDRSLQDGFGYPLPGRMVLVTLRVAGGEENHTP